MPMGGHFLVVEVENTGFDTYITASTRMRMASEYPHSLIEQLGFRTEHDDLGLEIGECININNDSTSHGPVPVPRDALSVPVFPLSAGTDLTKCVTLGFSCARPRHSTPACHLITQAVSVSATSHLDSRPRYRPRLGLISCSIQPLYLLV